MTRPRRSSTADRVFGRVPTGGGHGGPPNVVVGWTGSGEGDPELVEGSGLAGPLTRSGWSGSAIQRFFSEEANGDRVA
jgi:hypothetical protein